MTTPLEMLTKIDAQNMRRRRDVTFKIAEVAMPTISSGKVLTLIGHLRRSSVPAAADLIRPWQVIMAIAVHRLASHVGGAPGEIAGC